MRSYSIAQTDLVVSRIAFGFRDVAPYDSEGLSGNTAEKAHKLIHTAYDNGITFFDLAAAYGFGKAETAFGETLRRSPGLRNSIVVQTKCGIPFGEERVPGAPFYLDNSREHIVCSVEASLRRLHLERLDILLLHCPDALVEPDEVAEAFDALQRSGKVRYFGVSNHSAWQIEGLRRSVRPPLIANQIYLGLAHPYLLADNLEMFWEDGARLPHSHTGAASIMDYCRVHGLQVQAYSPLRGIKGSLIDPPPDAPAPMRDTAQVLATLAEKKGVPALTIALAWLLRHPVGIVPILGTMDPEHVRANCAADSITLDRAEWYSLFISAARARARWPHVS